MKLCENKSYEPLNICITSLLLMIFKQKKIYLIKIFHNIADNLKQFPLNPLLISTYVKIVL